MPGEPLNTRCYSRRAAESFARERPRGTRGISVAGCGRGWVPVSPKGDQSFSQIVSGEFSRAGGREDAGAAQKPTSSGVGWLEVTLGQPGRRDRCAETFRAGSAATKPGSWDSVAGWGWVEPDSESPVTCCFGLELLGRVVAGRANRHGAGSPIKSRHIPRARETRSGIADKDSLLAPLPSKAAPQWAIRAGCEQLSESGHPFRVTENRVFA